MNRPKFSLLPQTRRAWVRSGAVLGVFLITILSSINCITKMPGQNFTGPLPPLTANQNLLSFALEKHVRTLAVDIGERNVANPDALEKSVAYITRALQDSSYTVTEQKYTAMHTTVKNIIAELPGGSHADEIVIIGAHYDAVLGCPAANDNGSGVAAVLEIAKAMAASKPDRTIRFVAFVNEEPPFFQTEQMGSMVYAKACREQNDNIVAMLTPETIGCYTDEPNSQHYPPPLNLLYPDTGNFVAFVGNYASRPLVHQAIISFRKHAQFPSEGIAAPGFINGIGWSDHWSFWQYDYPGIMVTDTAPFRYNHYHKATDTPDKMNFDRMARVVEGLIHVTSDLASHNNADS